MIQSDQRSAPGEAREGDKANAGSPEGYLADAFCDTCRPTHRAARGDGIAVTVTGSATATTPGLTSHPGASTPATSASWRDRRRRTWLTTSGRALALRVDEPHARQAVGALVVVPSFGREATVSFRATRALAAQAAAAGFVAYTFDLTGDGDSQDLHRGDDPGRCWAADVTAVVALARAAVGPQLPVHVVGLRLGASILASTPRIGPGHRIYWEPVSGRMFLRTHQLIRTKAVGVGVLPEGVELDGTHLSDAQAAGVAALKAPRQQGSVPPTGDEQQDCLRREDDREAGLRIALGAPYFANVPLEAIAQIVAGLPQGSPRSLPPWQGLDSVTVQGSGGSPVIETLCEVGPRRLPAVHTRCPSATPRLGAVFTAMGAEVRSGPGGLWARAARDLAERGVVSLRADRAYLGDDAEPDRACEARPYTDVSVDSVREAIEHLRGDLGTLPIVGVGVCAGAWALLRASAACRLNEVVAINTVHFNPAERVYNEAFYRHYHGEQAPALAAGRHGEADPGVAGDPRSRIVARARRLTETVRQDLAIRYPRLRAMLRPGVPVDHVAPLLRDVPDATRVRFVLGPQEYRIFTGKGGRRALARSGRRAGNVRAEVETLVDHSLFAEAARRRVLHILIDVARPYTGSVQ